jgi:hypothetical protein
MRKTMKKRQKQVLSIVAVVLVLFGIFIYLQNLQSTWNQPTQPPIITYHVGEAIGNSNYAFAGWETVGSGPVDTQVFANFTSTNGQSNVSYNYSSTIKTVILTNPYNVISESITNNTITLQEIIAAPM